MARQLRLKLERETSWRREDFIVSPANADAARLLDAWPNWHGGCLALVGPAGVGKTHLARSWAESAGAHLVVAGQPERASGPLLVEDIHVPLDSETLFHFINRAGEPGGGLLITARTPPATWPTDLPDLRSRLNAMPVAEIAAPDDTVLTGVLRRLFEARHIRPADDLFPYLLWRMERSVPMAREIVARLDEAGGEAGRPITRALAREVLDDGQSDLLD